MCAVCSFNNNNNNTDTSLQVFKFCSTDACVGVVVVVVIVVCAHALNTLTYVNAYVNCGECGASGDVFYVQQ